LEDYYGVELFHRRGRRVELTETGMELYAVTQRMEILEREAQDVLQTAGGFQSGHLRVGAVGPYHLTEMLAVFRERFPYLKITVTVRNSEDILENLLNFEVDVAVLVIDEVQMIDDNERGWAWANAIIGTPAAEIIMTGSPNVKDAIVALAIYLNEELEIIEFER